MLFKWLNSRNITIRTKQKQQVSQFLSALAKEKVKISDLYVVDGVIHFKTRSGHLPTIRKLRRKYHVNIELELMDRYSILRNESSVLLGLGMLLFIPYILSFFLWSIKIEADTPERAAAIGAMVEEMGIKSPILRTKIPDEAAIRQNILAKDRELSWVHFTNRGGQLTVSPLPAPKLERNVPEPSRPSHLIATKSGVITHFEITSGEKAVTKNTAVYTGDTLVSGVVKQGGKDVAIGAEGNVYADYWIECTFTLPKKIEYLKPLDHKAQLIIKGIKNDVQENEAWKTMKLPSFLDPYVKIVYTQSFEKVSQEINEQSVNDIILPLLHQKYIASLPPKTMIKQEKILQIAIDNDTVKGKVLFLVNENIAKKQPIYQGD